MRKMLVHSFLSVCYILGLLQSRSSVSFSSHSMFHLRAITFILMAPMVICRLMIYAFTSKPRSFCCSSDLLLKLFRFHLPFEIQIRHLFPTQHRPCWAYDFLHCVFPQATAAPPILLHNTDAPIMFSHMCSPLLSTLKLHNPNLVIAILCSNPSLVSYCSSYEYQDPNKGRVALYWPHHLLYPLYQILS